MRRVMGWNAERVKLPSRTWWHGHVSATGSRTGQSWLRRWLRRSGKLCSRSQLERLEVLLLLFLGQAWSRHTGVTKPTYEQHCHHDDGNRHPWWDAFLHAWSSFPRRIIAHAEVCQGHSCAIRAAQCDFSAIDYGLGNRLRTSSTACRSGRSSSPPSSPSGSGTSMSGRTPRFSKLRPSAVYHPHMGMR